MVGQLVVNPNVHSKEFPDISNCTSLEQVFKETASHRKVKYNNERKLNIRLAWFKEIQDKYYKDINSFLNHGIDYKVKKGKQLLRNRKIKVPELCLEMSLFLDNKGLIRVKTLLELAENIPWAANFTVLLNKKRFVYKDLDN